MKERPIVLLVGGRGKKNIELAEKVESFGVIVGYQWEAHETSGKKTIPKDVDMVLVMVDVIAHRDEDKVRKLARAANKPVYRTGKNRHEIASAIAGYFGYDKDGNKIQRGSKNDDDDAEAALSQQAIRGAARSTSMPFASWVEQVQLLRGAPLNQENPYGPAVRAFEGTTWYDVWFKGVEPEDAAKLGSRSIA